MFRLTPPGQKIVRNKLNFKIYRTYSQFQHVIQENYYLVLYIHDNLFFISKDQFDNYLSAKYMAERFANIWEKGYFLQHIMIFTTMQFYKTSHVGPAEYQYIYNIATLSKSFDGVMECVYASNYYHQSFNHILNLMYNSKCYALQFQKCPVDKKIKRARSNLSDSLSS